MEKRQFHARMILKVDTIAYFYHLLNEANAKSTRSKREMQGYRLSVVVQGEGTKQAWWIMIQMFSTGTLNGMQSRLASRKILITHLISHCTSSAPGGAPACMVTECESVREATTYNGVHFTVGRCRLEWQRQKKSSVTHQLQFSLTPAFDLPPHIAYFWIQQELRRDELHV